MIGIRLTATQQQEDDSTDGKMFSIQYRSSDGDGGTNEEMHTAIARHILSAAIVYTEESRDQETDDKPGPFVRTYTLEIKLL